MTDGGHVTSLLRNHRCLTAQTVAAHSVVTCDAVPVGNASVITVVGMQMSFTFLWCCLFCVRK